MKYLTCENTFGLFLICLYKSIIQISVETNIYEELLLNFSVFGAARTKSYPPSVLGVFGASRFIQIIMTNNGDCYHNLLYIWSVIECEKVFFQISSGKIIHEPGFIH